MSIPPSILELPSPFLTEYGTIRLLESPDADGAVLLEKVRSGTYGKPFVLDDGTVRTLYFSLEYMQSSMRIDDPYGLELAYTRKMMSFLLFHARPRKLLILGLGGGSLAKYCHRHLSHARITVVEIDPHVLAFRDQFNVPSDDSRLRTIQGDAAEYLSARGEEYDVIMMDAFDRDGLAGSVCTWQFYADVQASLSPCGLVVANLAGLRDERAIHLEMVRDVFGDNVLVLPVQDGGNHVAFGFRDPEFEPRWGSIDSQARAMRSRYGLDFPAFARKLAKTRKSGALQRVFSRRGAD